MIIFVSNSTQEITLNEPITNFNKLLVESHFGNSTGYGAQIEFYVDLFIKGDFRWSYIQDSTYNYNYCFNQIESDRTKIKITRTVNGWISNTGSEINIYGIGRK